VFDTRPPFPVSFEKQVGASMSNEDEKPMTEDQATDLKVTTKLKKQGYENGLSKAEADKRIKEVKKTSSG
jgi:Protein of unknown function (DUF3072)